MINYILYISIIVINQNIFLGENDVEVAESLASWVQNKQRTKQQNNRDTVTDTCRYIYCFCIKTIGNY